MSSAKVRTAILIPEDLTAHKNFLWSKGPSKSKIPFLRRASTRKGNPEGGGPQSHNVRYILRFRIPHASPTNRLSAASLQYIGFVFSPPPSKTGS